MDRGALRHIVKERSHDKTALCRPGKLQKRETRTSIEKVLQGLWAQIWSLDPSQIDLDSQFLSLGGDSLTAIRLATMCRERGFKLEVADILGNTKFEHLARLVEQRQDSAPNSLHLTRKPTENQVPRTAFSIRCRQPIPKLREYAKSMYPKLSLSIHAHRPWRR